MVVTVNLSSKSGNQVLDRRQAQFMKNTLAEWSQLSVLATWVKLSLQNQIPTTVHQCREGISSLLTVYQPYFSLMSGICQPWNGRIIAVCQLYVSRMSAIPNLPICRTFILIYFIVIAVKIIIVILILMTGEDLINHMELSDS